MSEKRMSKADAIRRVLAEHPDLWPKEIAELVSGLFGYEVSAQYVSTIKTQQKKRMAASSSVSGHDALDAAVRLVRKAGGLDEARACLDRLERRGM